MNDSAAKQLELSNAERIEKIRSPRWIGYPRAKVVLAKLEDLLVYPRSHRMPNMLVVGDTNNGKTMLVQRFCSLHPADNNPSGDGVNDLLERKPAIALIRMLVILYFVTFPICLLLC